MTGGDAVSDPDHEPDGGVSRIGTDARRDHDEGVSTLAKQGGLAFAGNVVSGALGYAIVMLMTRFVSPSIYGLFVLATSIILFTQVAANLGFPLAIDYFVPRYLNEGEHGKAKGVIVKVMVTVFVTSSLVALALAASAGFVGEFFREPSMRIALLLLAVTIPMRGLYKCVLTSYYSVKRLQYRVVVHDILRPTVRFVVTAALLLSGFGLLGLIGGYVIALFVALAIGAFVFATRVRKIAAADLESVPFRRLATYSVPLAMTSVVFVLMGQVDYFVVGYYLDSGDVGIYRVGYMLGSSLLIIFGSLSPVFKPLIAESGEDRDLVERRFRVAARWIAGLTLPIAITLSLAAPEYLSVFYTPQYADASAVVALLSTAFLFNVTFGGPDGTLLQGMGYSRVVFGNTLVLFGANLGVSMALVPVLGIEGAAVGSATALVLVGLLTIAECYYLDGIHPFTRDFAKVVLSGIPATIAGVPVVLLVDSALVVVTVLPLVVVGTYALSLIATDAFTAEDARMVAQFSPAFEKWLPSRLSR
ncbi:flippase [Natrialbaceae archaeon GCM10025810]|uniref:flippase n=1 Tax=Halovalidus salilacus TaxID=3075124 RepID=UPI00360F316C